MTFCSDVGVGVWVWSHTQVCLYMCGEGVEVIDGDLLVENFEGPLICMHIKHIYL